MRKILQHSAAREMLINPVRRSPVDTTSPVTQTVPPSKTIRQGHAHRQEKPAGDRNVDVLVLGAGASGLMCAREAAGRGLQVAVLESGPVPGRKLAISGGGKANFSNRSVSPSHFRCNGASDSAFCTCALKSFSPEHMLRLVRKWNLPIDERGHGQLFLKVPAQRLVAALVDDCRTRKASIFCQCSVTGALIRPDGGFTVQTTKGPWQCASLVLALGSPAWPQAGGSGTGYHIAQTLGHDIIPPRPALVPLKLATDSPLLSLAGISVPTQVSLGDKLWEDDLLFTHEGLSGPVALKASLFWMEGMPLTLDFLPGQNLTALFDAPHAGKQTPRTILARLLPQRLVDTLLPQETARRKTAEISRTGRQAMVAAVQRHVLTPTGTAGLKKAEVCVGGVNTAALAPETMRSTICPNLYIIGEMVDVTGLLGGYNLHWAWASGMAAGRSVTRYAPPL